MNAYDDNATTLDKILITLRTLYRSGEQKLLYLSSIEYDGLICDAKNVHLLDNFARYLNHLCQWKDELHTQDNEDIDSRIKPSTDCTKGFPHLYKNEKAFLNQIIAAEY
jgi:hypothetical protein